MNGNTASGPVPLIIDGVDTKTDHTFGVCDPQTGIELWKAYGSTAKEANAAAEAAQRAFPIWSGMSYLERRDLLLKAAGKLAARIEELKQISMQETAAARDWADFDCDMSVFILREAASLISSITAESPPTLEPDSTALVYKVPFGVVLSIAPWNAPVLLGTRSIAYPLAGGNTVVLKASELSARSHFLLAECFRDAGFPPGVVNVVAHEPARGPEVIGALIKHPAVRKINFTGSTIVGRILAQQAARELKPILLELGGKAPIIVLEGADVKSVAMSAAWSSNAHAGQVCMAAERIIVLDSVAADLETALAQTYKEMYPSSSYKPQPAIQTSGVQKVQELLEDATANGAAIVAGEPTATSGTTRSLQPVVLKNVEKSKLFYTESFGPVLSLIVVPTIDEAVRVANDTEYGLSASVWGNLPEAIKVAKRIDSGAVHINGSTIHDEPTLPHGGFKSSGTGRFGGKWGVAEFMTTKTIRFKV
ncbi:aldehyde dehydrogenase domain-containing protein [Exophiala viscosa]|uniref:Aldehyde dehydrogenase domain-containing protein n=1 Tax=Exophiala viscosa TaxID=2486360 RepID=A0AAN6E336_9EURO|nr:aldehyde dehydrogenase domain-containing protein [Exophiala viscosa]